MSGQLMRGLLLNFDNEDAISYLSNNDIINNTYKYRIDLRVNYFF